ncbi:hypothetical protein CcCBS67573_g00039 [Chytriomyces confervae]|uniref:Uncharacterized protein n=1 Tax=Chytriomyces confervae TaxID=246404 RepID=A0A507FQF0_9FUNG|nr:hypothetical protein HDU80_004834 [Chytriomyces hyalinus]TPX78651.1 hypothetical protein CcCBS67573_g00039 [Chytriomyces confervae]
MEPTYTAQYPRSNLFSAASIASDAANTGRRSGLGFRTGLSRRGPPSVAESMASQDSFSAGTKTLFKSMMGASKLSSFQQRMLDDLVNSGSALPPKPTPGLAPSNRPPSSFSFSSGSTMHASQADLNAQRRLHKKQVMKSELLNPRAGLRSLSTILESDAFKEEIYRPPVTKNFVAEKCKLQKFMETDGGKNVSLIDEDLHLFNTGAHGEAARVTHGRRRGHGLGTVARAAEGPERDDIDEFDMVFKEIEERKQWLDDMVSLGRGDVYRQQIQNEISSRVKRLEQIDRERTTKSAA